MPQPCRPSWSIAFFSRCLRLLLTVLVIGVTASPSQAAEPAQREVTARDRIGDRIDDEDRVTLTGHVHRNVREGEDRGRVDDARPLNRMILALGADAARADELDALIAELHDPASPRFGQWLTPAEFARRFGASDHDLAVVTAWLRRHGFRIDEIPAGRRSVVFSGSAGQIRATFRTEIHHVRWRGEDHVANVANPQIPDALANVVSGIVSLHDFHSRPLNSRATPAYTSGTSHALAPADFATIYNLKPLTAQGIDGAGRSIAVLGRTSVLMSDILQFRTAMGLPTTNLPQIVVNGSNPGRQSGDEGESDLDLEWAGAVAPAATIKFITSASTATTDGIDLSAQYAVSNNVADVITLSYGQCEATLGTTGVAFYNGLWQQAAAQGISVFVSSGDSGAAGCAGGNDTVATGGLAVNGLCSSPYSTCVGGTQFDDTASPGTYWSSSNTAGNLGSALSYIPEIVWNESGTVSGGSGLWSSSGGASISFTKPSWQSVPGMPADGRRDVPDVSLTAASHDGYLVYSSDNATSTQTRYVFGGTSASAPSFAGLMALVNQRTGYRQGNANPRFYQLASSQAAGGPAYYHAVTRGNNSVPGLTGFSASATTPYYNLATGLGSVDASVLVQHWTDVLPASTTTLSAAPAAPAYREAITLTATVTGATPTGTVQFFDGASALGAAVPLVGGSAGLSTSALAIGTHTLTAVYSGDPANNASSSSGLALTVSPARVTVSLASSQAAVAQGQPVTFSVLLSGASPSGTVQFLDGATLLGSVTVTNCTASLTTSSLAPGVHTVTAVYSGDASNQAGSATAVSVTVTPTAVPGAASDADIPALPVWAMLLALVLLSLVHIRNGHVSRDRPR